MRNHRLSQRRPAALSARDQRDVVTVTLRTPSGFAAWTALLIALSGWAVGTAHGADWYVDNVAGDDQFNGTAAQTSPNRDGPFRTIARALRTAQAGDRIHLAKNAEPYRESITLQGGRHSGRFGQPFRLLGNGAILDGSGPVPLEAWEPVAGDIHRFAPFWKAHQMLFRDDRPLTRVPCSGNDPGIPRLQPLEWCLYRGHIYFRTEPGRLPGNYDLTHATQTVGITLYEVRDVVVEDLIVQGFQLDGVCAHDSVFGGSLKALTCRGNGRAGISVRGASRVRIESCLLGDNGRGQLFVEDYSRTQLSASRLLESPLAPAVVRLGGQLIEQDDAP